MKLESLKTFKLQNEELALLTGGTGKPVPEMTFTGSGTVVINESNTMSYDGDISRSNGHITYINCNNINP